MPVPARLDAQSTGTTRSLTARNLRVVSQQAFSALPHTVLFDGSLAHGEIVLYAILQSYWWQSGECFASHATLAGQMGVKERMLRNYLKKLVKAGHIVERRHGQGQAKAYSPVETGTVLPVEAAEDCRLKRQENAASKTNRQPVADEAATECQLNRQPVAALRRLPEDKKEPELSLPGEDAAVAADAAPDPAPVDEPTPKKSRKPRRSREDEGTLAPDTIELTDQSYETAAKWGFGRADVAFQLERFLSKARAKGWRYLNWKEAFRNWLLNEVSYAKRDGRKVGGQAPTLSTAQPAPSAPVRMKVY